MTGWVGVGLFCLKVRSSELGLSSTSVKFRGSHTSHKSLDKGSQSNPINPKKAQKALINIP